MKANKFPNLFKVEKSLGPLESKIMKVMWEKNGRCVSDVTKVLQGKSQIAYTTVMTTMDTLFKKGFLTRQKVGKAYQYKVLASRETYTSRALAFVLSKLIYTFGRKRVLFTITRIELKRLSRVKLPLRINSITPDHKASVLYGASFTFVAFLLIYTTWELIQNFKFYGTSEYISLALSEPKLVFNRFGLLISAIIESVPIVNLFSMFIFIFLFIITTRKLIEHLKLKTHSFSKSEGLI